MESDHEDRSGDRVRTLLRELIAKSGFTHAEVSRTLQRNHAYIHQFLKQGKPTYLSAPIRFALARLFDINPDILRGDEEPRSRRTPRESLNPRLVQRTTDVVETLIGDLGMSAAIEAEVFAGVYALLERESVGHPISDDEDTLAILRSLIVRCAASGGSSG